MTDKIRNHLLSAGVKNLKEYGYPSVTIENITTDEIYREFFKSMLESNLGNPTTDPSIRALIAECSA